VGNNSWTHPPFFSRHLTLQNLRNITFVGVAHAIFFGCGAHDILWEWRARYLLGVAHTIFVGCGAHDVFWEWRTRYSFWGSMGPQTKWRTQGLLSQANSAEPAWLSPASPTSPSLASPASLDSQLPLGLGPESHKH